MKRLPAASCADAAPSVASPLDTLPKAQAQRRAAEGIAAFRAALPSEFRRADTLTSLAFVARDLALVVATATVFSCVGCSHPLIALAYALTQGTVAVGVWMLGHEAVHGSLLPHRGCNDALGALLHAAMLVPFSSWGYMRTCMHAIAAAWCLCWVGAAAAAVLLCCCAIAAVLLMLLTSHMVRSGLKLRSVAHV